MNGNLPSLHDVAEIERRAELKGDGSKVHGLLGAVKFLKLNYSKWVENDSNHSYLRNSVQYLRAELNSIPDTIFR